MIKVSRLLAASALVCAVPILSVVAVAPAQAALVVFGVNANLSTAPYTFSYGDSSFTFSATGDIFNPLAVRTGGTGAVNSFGGFLGIPVTPTSNFPDRGVVTFGPSNPYTAFPTATTVPYSNGGNLIGLRATSAAGSFYGFAYTVDNIFRGYGFENVAGATVTATTAVPEPATWGMMILGFGIAGAALRRRRVAAAATA